MTETADQPERTATAEVGERLRMSFGALLDTIPEIEKGPTAVARRVGVNRVLVSRLLNALKREDPLEVLQHVPGPDSLRSIADGASLLESVSRDAVQVAMESVDGFATLIRDGYGTRGALNAAISDDSEALRTRYEEAARYKVYDGMRHLLGVEGETWLTSMIFSPNPVDPDALSVTTVHGVLGMHRLRPDVPVRFTYGPPYAAPNVDPSPLAPAISLAEFYTNEAAPLQTEVRDGHVVHWLESGGVGKDALVDMLAVSHNPRGCGRYAGPGRTLGGAAVFHDVPVKTLHCDAVVHRDAFPGVSPRVITYNPGPRGPANPNDPARDIDRMDVSDPVELIAGDSESLQTPGVARYREMLERVFEHMDQSLRDYRVYRHRMSYPVQGFQYVMAFEAPTKPE